jgi:hypothetical protein
MPDTQVLCDSGNRAVLHEIQRELATRGYQLTEVRNPIQVLFVAADERGGTRYA